MAVRAMVTMETIKALLNARLSRLLDVAQASLPERQFLAFRKIALDEFGRKGLENDLRKEFKQFRDTN
jgi:hypothetical protein